MGMAGGPKRHLKRLNAPKSWLLDKEGGVFAPRPSTGPHTLKDCIPLCLILTKKLKLASTSKEVHYLMKMRMVRINGRVRTDPRFPVGVMDVVSLEDKKTSKFEHFRLFYNTAGRFHIHKINEQESKFRLSKISRKSIGKGNIPYLYTNDGSTFRFCDQEIEVNDTVKIDLEEGKIVDFLHIEVGNIAFIKKGKNMGCTGSICEIEKRPYTNSFIKLKDSNGRDFSTTDDCLIVIGKKESWVTLPQEKGVKISEVLKSHEVYGGVKEEIGA